MSNLTPNLTPKDQDLDVDWIRKFENGRAVGPKIYVAVCKCGSKHLLQAEKGIRCCDCSAFHTFDSFKLACEKAKRLAFGGNIAETRIVKVIEDKTYKDRLRDKLIRMGLIKRKIIV